MTCVLPQWSPCRVNPTDDWAPLVAAGSLLLLLTLSLVIFDRRGVPCIIGKRLSGLSHDTKQGKPTSLGQPHLVPSSDALRLAAAMPIENLQVTGPARGRALVSALWTIFLPVSTVAVLVRMAMIVAYLVVLPRQLPVARAVPELLMALIPFLWCVCRVRSASAAQVAFCGPGSRCPRFSSFALATVAAEMYSTIVASMAVATTPCGVSPWRTVLFYCLGVMVTVLRCYSAVLALRLQDLAAGTCRRVLPQENDAPVGTGDIQCSLELEDPQVEKKGFTSNSAWEEALANADENLLCACLPDSCCPVTRKRFAGRRLLLQGGLCFAVSSAVLSAVAARAASGDGASAGPPSSCGVARNSTTSCVPWQLAGTHLFDRRTGDLQMDLANTLEDCCGGCDELDECQAWIFERLAKRCRWIRFEDEVCKKNPEHLGCRCVTNSGTAFGFKAKSNLVWLTAT